MSDADAPQADVKIVAEDASSFGLTRQVAVLRHKLQLVRRNVSLLLIYATVFLDFIGLTLLHPGLRFMVSPTHPHAFDDIRLPSHCFGANNGTVVAGCIPRTEILPGEAISWMMFSYGFGQLLSSPIMGVTSDKIGARRVLIVSTAGTAAAFVLQGFTWSFWPHIGTRFVGGLFSGSRPVCAAYIAASVPPHERAKYMGYMALAVMAALQFGPVLGGSLAQVHLKLPLFVAAAMAALTLGLLLLYLTDPPRKDGAPNKGRSARAAEASGGAAGDGSSLRVLKFLLCALAATGMFQQMSAPIVLPIMLADDYGMDPNQIGLLQWGDGICLLLGNQAYTRISAKRGLCVVAILGSLMSVFQIAIPYTNTLVTFSLFRSLAMIGPPMVQPVAPAIASLVAPAKHMGAWMAAVMMMSAVVRAFSPPLLGPMYDRSRHAPFAITGAASSLTLLSAYLLDRRVPRPRKPAAAASLEAARLSGSAEPAASAHAHELTEIDEPSPHGVAVLEDGARTSLRADEHADAPGHAPAAVDLAMAYARLSEHKRKLEEAGDDGADDDADEPTERDVRELGEWMAKMLLSRGYRRWHIHKPGIHAIISNAFPRIREHPKIDRLTDLLGVIGAHFELERSWAGHQLSQQEHCIALAGI